MLSDKEIDRYYSYEEQQKIKRDLESYQEKCKRMITAHITNLADGSYNIVGTTLSSSGGQATIRLERIN